MTSFIWTLVSIMGFECVVKILLLAKGRTTEPTLLSTAFDVILLIALIVWGVTLVCR